MEVNYEHEIIAQDHWTHPGSVAPNKYRFVGGDDSGGSASLSAAGSKAGGQPASGRSISADS
jgi:hypothetical protein